MMVKFGLTNGFLQGPFSFLLTVNVDWFQPFSHIQYSVGAIYLTIQNLPRSERYKVILVGVLPGPHENSYLGPLVEELKLGWSDGIVGYYSKNGYNMRYTCKP